MKYAFSTLACPGWEWDEILATAKDFGFDGIEVRGIGRELFAPDALPFQAEHRPKTAEQLKRLGLGLACLSSECLLNDRAHIDTHMQRAKAYIDTAAQLAEAGITPAPFVRVLTDTAPEPGEGVNAELVANDLAELADYAAKKNVTVLVETNGVFANTDEMLRLLTQTGHPSNGLAVLWDIHHTYRYFGEAPSVTYDKLKPYIRHVHVKDSVYTDGRVAYRMMGGGDIPVPEALEALRNGGYTGYVSLEWVKRWQPELAEPGIVLPLFISYMKQLGRV